MRQECYFCQVRGVEKLISKFNIEANKAEDFVFCAHELIGKSRDVENARLAADIHRMARSFLNEPDLYLSEKQHANQLLLDNYEHWKKTVTQSENPFRDAARLAVIGNIIDYGAGTVSEDISAQIVELYQQELTLDMSRELQKEIESAESILYLGDNCGEIVLDKLFIEAIDHPGITYVVRGAPVLNDATMDDARQVGMDNLCHVISNGADAPSTLLELCSAEFADAFNEADLIISKGQGNFEGLVSSRHPNIFFMLIAKCAPMAGLLGVRVNDMVITKLGR